MAQDVSIDWPDKTWNPVRGCTRRSPGCDRCYAAAFAERWRGIPGHPYEKGFDPRAVEERLGEPFTWTRPCTVLVSSMGDLFHEAIPDEHVARVFEAMRLADWHVYHVLTKHAERLQRFVRRHCGKAGPPPHVRLGVSAEDRRHGAARLAKLRATPAGLRFLFLEPLLEDPGKLDLAGIGWVLVGGESGPGARPLRREWVVSVQKQCRLARIPFFFKQWSGARRGEAGRELDGRTWDQVPRLPELTVPPRAERRRRLEELRGADLVP
jgi:protein gp37